MPLLSRKKVIKVKNETTKGTAESATMLEVMVYNPTINPENVFHQRQLSAWIGNFAGVVGERSGRCTFSTELKGDGTDALNDGLEALLLACGMALATKVYSPTSLVATQKTVTILVYEDGIKKSICGAMGNVSISGEFGKPVMLEFDFLGRWVAPSDTALPTPTAETILPMRLASCTLSLGDETPAISTFTFSPNNSVVIREDVSEASGIGYCLISDRDPTIALDMEADLVANDNAYGLWLAGTTAALSLALADADVSVTIAAAKVQNRSVTEGDRNGVLTHELLGQCIYNTAGDDEFTITTAAI